MFSTAVFHHQWFQFVNELISTGQIVFASLCFKSGGIDIDVKRRIERGVNGGLKSVDTSPRLRSQIDESTLIAA